MRTIYKVENLYPYEAINISTGKMAPYNDCPPISNRRMAINNNWWIERKVYNAASTKAGQVFWTFIKDLSSVQYLVNTQVGVTSTPNPTPTPNHKQSIPTPAPKKKVVKTVSKVVKKKVKVLLDRDFSAEVGTSKSIKDLLVPENLPNDVPDATSSDEAIVKFIMESYKYKPHFMKISETKWKLLVRASLRGENAIIVGDKGEGKTIVAMALANALGRPLFKLNFGNMQDAQTVLIGKTHFDTTKGTVFSKSYFVEAITTPHSIILLDELSRSTDDAMNIMFPVLDQNQRYLRLNDEINAPIVEVAEGVCFIATANIGHEYTGTRQLDAALKDRFSTKIEVDHLDIASRSKLLKEAFPSLTTDITDRISKIAHTINDKVYSQDSSMNITIPLSTRMCLSMAKLINDGFTPMQAIEATVYPEYSDDGGTQSERTSVKQIVQGFNIDQVERIYESQKWDTKEVEETINEEIEEWV